MPLNVKEGIQKIPRLAQTMNVHYLEKNMAHLGDYTDKLRKSAMEDCNPVGTAAITNFQNDTKIVDNPTIY